MAKKLTDDEKAARKAAAEAKKNDAPKSTKKDQVVKSDFADHPKFAKFKK